MRAPCKVLRERSDLLEQAADDLGQLAGHEGRRYEYRLGNEQSIRWVIPAEASVTVDQLHLSDGHRRRSESNGHNGHPDLGTRGVRRNRYGVRAATDGEAPLVPFMGTRCHDVVHPLARSIGSTLRAEIWRRELEWITIGQPRDTDVEERSSRPTVLSQARELEIFLDHVAMHACSSSSYLLDERYAALVGDDVDAVEKSRTAARAVPAKQESKDQWKPLRDTFAAHGFRQPR